LCVKHFFRQILGEKQFSAKVLALLELNSRAQRGIRFTDNRFKFYTNSPEWKFWGWGAVARVTRLGEFSPIGRLLTLAFFQNNIIISHLRLLFHKTVVNLHSNFDKTRFWGDFFKKSIRSPWPSLSCHQSKRHKSAFLFHWGAQKRSTAQKV
jgi:hypothetical protein